MSMSSFALPSFMVWDVTQPATEPSPPAALSKDAETTTTGMSPFLGFGWATSTPAPTAEERQEESTAIEAVDSGMSRNNEEKREGSDQQQEFACGVIVTDDKAGEVEVEIEEVAPLESKKMSFNEEAADHLRHELANYLMKQKRKETEKGRGSKKKSKEKKRSELKKYLKRTLKTYLDERSSSEVVSREEKESIQDLKMGDVIDDTVSWKAETEGGDKEATERTPPPERSPPKETPKEPTLATAEVDRKNLKQEATKATPQEPISEPTKGEVTKEASEAVPMDATEEALETSTETSRGLDKREALAGQEKKAKGNDAKEVAKKVKARLAAMEMKVREAATKAAKEKKAKEAGEKKHRRKDSFVLQQRKGSFSLHGKSMCKPACEDGCVSGTVGRSGESVAKSFAEEGELPRTMPVMSDSGVSKLASGLESLIQSEYKRLEEINNCMEEEKKRTAKRLEVEKRKREARHKEAIERFEIKKQIIRGQREEREAQLKLEFEREVAVKEASKEAARHTAALNKALEDFKKWDRRCGNAQAMDERSQISEKSSKSFTKVTDQEETWKKDTQDVSTSGGGFAGVVVCRKQQQQQLQGEIVDELEKIQTLQDDFIQKVKKSPKLEGPSISDLLQAPKLARGESLRSLKSETSLFDGSSILMSDLFKSPKAVSSSILRSDLFSKRILSGPLKSKKSKQAESLIEKELWRLRKEQSALFAKGRELTSELSDISEHQSKLDLI